MQSTSSITMLELIRDQISASSKSAAAPACSPSSWPPTSALSSASTPPTA